MVIIFEFYIILVKRLKVNRREILLLYDDEVWWSFIRGFMIGLLFISLKYDNFEI